MQREYVENSVVLAGAGISVDEPSNLPKADQLVDTAFVLLTKGADLSMPPDGLGRLRAKVRNLRLELALELITREADPSKVLSIFQLLEAARPNRNHLALALLRPTAVLTPNQDRLLESAATGLGATLDVRHLHGTADNPSGIVSLLRQYMIGLPRAVQDAVAKVIRRKDLLVLGYSGRDRDIVRAIIQAAPRHITWV